MYDGFGRRRGCMMQGADLLVWAIEQHSNAASSAASKAVRRCRAIAERLESCLVHG